MEKSLNRLLEILGGRLARNIYLWVIILFLVFNNDTHNRHYDFLVYAKATLITTFIIAALAYFNNLVLVPRLLIKKRYLLYFLIAGATLYMFSVFFILAIKGILHYYPGIEVHQISLISTPVSQDWSMSAIMDEIGMFFFGFFLWMLAMTMAWYMNDYARQQKLIEATNKKQVETELGFLKNQINPHFLFNTLNNLYGLALKKSEKSPDAILRLSSILRYLLYESNTEKVPFEKDKEVMMAYIELELLRLPENDNFHFTITADDNYRVPPLLWVPILENIFKHATKVISDNYYIDYEFAIENNVIRITSRNNYRPALNGEIKKAGGIGLENFKKRLALLYPKKHQLSYGQQGEYYIVEAQIDIS